MQIPTPRTPTRISTLNELKNSKRVRSVHKLFPSSPISKSLKSSMHGSLCTTAGEKQLSLSSPLSNGKSFSNQRNQLARLKNEERQLTEVMKKLHINHQKEASILKGRLIQARKKVNQRQIEMDELKLQLEKFIPLKSRGKIRLEIGSRV